MQKYLLSGKTLKILLHLLVWTLLFVLITYFLSGDSMRDKAFIIELWVQLVFYGILFYLSYLVLVPRLFFSGRKVAFFLSVALIILFFSAALTLLRSTLEPVFHDRREFRQDSSMRINEKQAVLRSPHKPPPIRNWPVINFILTSCLVTGLSLGLRFSDKMVLNEKLRKEAEKEKANAELALLKHQINPHFLFNTLNSIYSLALIKSDMTAEAVMKLSDMMRYVVEDVGHETVPLTLELDYILHYVELQKIRLSHNVEVQMNIEGEAGLWKIPPLILVPFVENAFKYGTSSHEQAVIRIDLRVSGGQLSYLVYNQVFPGRDQTKAFGIGIQNTRQRLLHFYPGRHTLKISNDGAAFTVNLDLSLA